jgi:hypothetical protein
MAEVVDEADGVSIERVRGGRSICLEKRWKEAGEAGERRAQHDLSDAQIYCGR